MRVAVSRPLNESDGPLDDQFVMVDDASDISYDGQETASITYTSSDDEDGETHGEDVRPPMHEGHSEDESQPGTSADSETPEEEMLHSFLSDDNLETPRQSMIAGTILTEPIRSPTLKSPADLTSQKNPFLFTTAGHGEARYTLSQNGYTLRHVAILIFSIIGAVMAFWLSFSTNQSLPSKEEVIARRQALSSTFGDSVNLDHLLPFAPRYTADNYPGHVPFQGLLPNHIVVSFSKQAGARSYPSMRSARAYTPNNYSLDFDMHELVDGIYVFSIAPKRAHGKISVDILVDNPHMKLTAWHDFGVGEALLPWKQNMWKSRIAAPISAGVKATRTVTTDLTTQMTKELQLFRNNTLQMLQMMVHKSNITGLRKDLMVVQKDLTIWSGDLQKRWSTAAKAMVDSLTPTKQEIRAKLDRSHSQARRLTMPLSRMGKGLASGNPQDAPSGKKGCKHKARKLKKSKMPVANQDVPAPEGNGQQRKR